MLTESNKLIRNIGNTYRIIKLTILSFTEGTINKSYL